MDLWNRYLLCILAYQRVLRLKVNLTFLVWGCILLTKSVLDWGKVTPFFQTSKFDNWTNLAVLLATSMYTISFERSIFLLKYTMKNNALKKVPLFSFLRWLFSGLGGACHFLLCTTILAELKKLSIIGVHGQFLKSNTKLIFLKQLFI